MAHLFTPCDPRLPCALGHKIHGFMFLLVALALSPPAAKTRLAPARLSPSLSASLSPSADPSVRLSSTHHVQKGRCWGIPVSRLWEGIGQMDIGPWAVGGASS